METTTTPHHSSLTYDEVVSHGPACRPLDFPAPVVVRGVRVNALVVHPATGSRQVCSGVIHREAIIGGDMNDDTTVDERTRKMIVLPPQSAYWPQRRLQDAIYGSVWACLVLERHYGPASLDAARAAGVEPNSPNAPIVWEITPHHVAIKMVEWSRVHQMRGRLLEDPVKEVAAMQLLGQMTLHKSSPHVLTSMEVLQDGDFLYSVMPYCSGGDLFGVVVQHAEENGGEGGMTEPVARYWFRQILMGLHHLQSLGVCHRDLSLENVLVDEQNCVIIDMGMCLRIPYDTGSADSEIVDVMAGKRRRLMRPQGVCGKHNYMSPEVYNNVDNFDGFAIDLWAAGVILYIMLTGFPPYDHASLTDERFKLIIHGQLVQQLNQWDIYPSAEAGNLLQRMLRLHPRDRLTLAQIMSHPWVTNTDVQGPPMNPPKFSY